MPSRLLIGPVINEKLHGTAVQAQKFSFDLKITNLGNEPSAQFNISQVRLESAESQDIQDDFGGKSFSVGVINPDQSLLIPIGMNGQAMYGLIKVKVAATPLTGGNNLTFLQKNPYTSDLCEPTRNNNWVDYFYIKSGSNDLQEKTNRRIIILTIVTAVLAAIQAYPIVRSLFD